MILHNVKWEAFAQARARGARPKDAAQQAGYNPSRSHHSRLANDKKIIKRVEELLESNKQGGSRDLGWIIDELVRLAGQAGGDDKTPPDYAAARALLVEAARLKLHLPKHREKSDVEAEMPHAEWLKLYGAGA